MIGMLVGMVHSVEFNVYSKYYILNRFCTQNMHVIMSYICIGGYIYLVTLWLKLRMKG